MQIKTKILIFIVFLMGTALAMAFSGKDDASYDVVEAVSKIHSSDDQQELEHFKHEKYDGSFNLSSIKRKSPKPSKSSELFQSKSWFTAPPSQQISTLPPPPPTAPQLTFTFIGRMIDGNEVILFLSNNGRQYNVKNGDVIDDNYRVEKINATNAILTYLPMNIQQTLAFNSTAVGSRSVSEPQSNLSMQAPTPLSNQISNPLTP